MGLGRTGSGLTLCGALILALLAPGGAGAATVVNGDFESGTFAGWQVHRALEAGNWFAYQGIDEPLATKRGFERPIQAPPQGRYAAIADEINPDTLILSQEVALEPGLAHRLSLLAYYDSLVPIAVPALDTLSVDGEVLAGQANQQYRIDVMRPDSPIDSVAPGDVLRTLFRTVPGARRTLPPTSFSADLSPFAGQTVRLRVAVAAHEELLTAGVDAVSIDSVPPGRPFGPMPKAGSFNLGKAKVNRKNGTAVLPVRVPGPGLVKAKAGRSLQPGKVRAAEAGTVKVRLKPTASARATLRRKHKLRLKVAVSYLPGGGGAAETATVPVVLKLAPLERR
jgi:hypothetical protein